MTESVKNKRWNPRDQFQAERERHQASAAPFVRACGYLADAWPETSALLQADLVTEEDTNSWQAWLLITENRNLYERCRKIAVFKLHHAVRGSALMLGDNKNMLTAQRNLLAMLEHLPTAHPNMKRGGMDRLERADKRDAIAGARRSVGELSDEELRMMANDHADEAEQRPG